MKLAVTEDVESVREAHALAFPGSDWVGDDEDEYWLATDDRGAVVGFCSIMHIPEHKCVFLSRAAVTRAARGGRLHAQMIAARLQWAHDVGARYAITYVAMKGYPSLYNLMRAGFRGVDARMRGWRQWHVLYLDLSGKKKAPSGAFWSAVLPLVASP